MPSLLSGLLLYTQHVHKERTISANQVIFTRFVVLRMFV